MPLEYASHSQLRFSEQNNKEAVLLTETHETHSEHAAHESHSFFDRWWPVLVIAYGILFVTLLVSFHPTT
jgi:hypothetical protein